MDSTPNPSPDAFYAICKEANDRYKVVQNTRLQVYTSTTGSYWDQSSARLSRGWNSLILPEATKLSILEDCRKFLRSRAWFVQRGLPYRRGYLLHGLPGTGKTTTSTPLPAMCSRNWGANVSHCHCDRAQIGHLRHQPQFR